MSRNTFAFKIWAQKDLKYAWVRENKSHCALTEKSPNLEPISCDYLITSWVTLLLMNRQRTHLYYLEPKQNPTM